MKNTIVDSIKKYVLLCLCIVAVTTYSCKKDELKPSRSMLVINGSFKFKGGDTAIVVSWPKAMFSKDNSVSYQLDISTDSTFTTFPSDTFSLVVKDTASVTFTDRDLTPKKVYFARVKALASASSTMSAWLVSPRFLITDSIPPINIMYNIPDAEIIDTAVLVHWSKNENVTGFKITDSIHKTEKDITLTDENKADTSLLIGGLKPGTAYTIQLLAGKISYGIRYITTKQGITGSHIIDLSGISGRPAILYDTLPLVPAGSTVVLQRGQTYPFSTTLMLGNSVVIMSKPGFGPQATLDFKGVSFDCVDQSHIDSLVFSDLRMTGDFAAGYMINVSTSVTIGKIVIENSSISSLRGIARFKSSTPVIVNNVYVTNCIADSINGYGVVCVDNAAVTVNNIFFTNSSFINNNVVITSKSQSNSIMIRNCSFYNSPGSGKYVFDYSAALNITGGASISNCLFGMTGGAQWYRAGAATTVAVTGSYGTSDYASKLPAGLSAYPAGNSANTFKDGNHGDLTLIDINSPNAGDPRWWH